MTEQLPGKSNQQSWIAIVIIFREFTVTGLRIVALTKEVIIPAETGGKIKTAAQITSILVLFVFLFVKRR